MLGWLASMLRLGQVQEGRAGKGEEEKECARRLKLDLEIFASSV
jgi:hypothetical protein